MPSKTPAQAKLMRAVAHGWKPDRMKGPSRKVAKEFVSADKKAKGYKYGGLKKILAELKDKRTPEERFSDRYGTEPMTFKQAMKRAGGSSSSRAIRAAKALKDAGWAPAGKSLDDAVWYPTQETLTAPTEGDPLRTTQPIPGEGGLLEETPPVKAVAPPPLRAAIPERLRETIAGAGRAPPALMRYLQTMQGPEPEPVEMQHGGMMDFMFKGRMPQRGQPPGGGLARAAVQPGSAPGPQPGGAERFAFEGKSPIPGNFADVIQNRGVAGPQPRQGGGQGITFGERDPSGGGGGGPGGGGRFKGMGRAMQQAMQKLQQQRGGGGVGQGQPRPQPGGGGPQQQRQMPGAPGGGVPLRGVGRPPGMGRPGAGGPQRQIQPIGGGYNTGVAGGSRLLQPSGGAGMPGGANRIGMADQQGALARATQVQTGRPPMSRRQPFPGRGGPGGGFGRSRRRGFGRAR